MHPQERLARAELRVFILMGWNIALTLGVVAGVFMHFSTKAEWDAFESSRTERSAQLPDQFSAPQIPKDLSVHSISIVDENGVVRGLFTANDGTATTLSLNDSGGESIVSISSGSVGEGLLILRPNRGSIGVSLTALKSGGAVRIYSPQGKPTASMLTAEPNRGMLLLFDSNGEPLEVFAPK